MAPAAVFALPFFQLYSAIDLFDTHIAVALAHTLFDVPLAVWILEGFMSAVPKELDETAYVDGYSFPRFFVRIFCRRSRPAWRGGVLLLHVLVGRAVAGQDADGGGGQAHRGDHDAHGEHVGATSSACSRPRAC